LNILGYQEDVIPTVPVQQFAIQSTQLQFGYKPPEERENVTRWVIDQSYRKEQERLKIPFGTCICHAKELQKNDVFCCQTIKRLHYKCVTLNILFWSCISCSVLGKVGIQNATIKGSDTVLLII
jgi:hypothetical protein